MVMFVPEATFCWQALVQTTVRFLSSIIITTSSLITRNTILSAGVGPNPYLLPLFFVEFWRCLIHFGEKSTSWPKSRPRATKSRPKAAQEPPRAAQEPPRAAQEPSKSRPEVSKSSPRAATSHPEPSKSSPRLTQELFSAVQEVQKWYQKPCKNQCETRVVANDSRIVFCNSFGT